MIPCLQRPCLCILLPYFSFRVVVQTKDHVPVSPVPIKEGVILHEKPFSRRKLFEYYFRSLCNVVNYHGMYSFTIFVRPFTFTDIMLDICQDQGLSLLLYLSNELLSRDWISRDELVSQIKISNPLKKVSYLHHCIMVNKVPPLRSLESKAFGILKDRESKHGFRRDFISKTYFRGTTKRL